MKIRYITLCLISSAFFILSCESKPERPSSVLSETQKAYEGTDLNSVPPSTPPVKEPPQNADGVWHYICPNGHAGGGGTATPCPECGTNYIHNTAYHSSDAANPTTTPDVTTTPVTPPVTKTPEPAQNANGVWHYTCSNGCEGGAGSAVACGKCGNTLTHNTAYH